MINLRKTYKNYLLNQDDIFKKNFKEFIKNYYDRLYPYLSSPEVFFKDKKEILSYLNLEEKLYFFLLFLCKKNHFSFLEKMIQDLDLEENLFKEREEIYKIGLKVYSQGTVLDLTPKGIISYLRSYL